PDAAQRHPGSGAGRLSGRRFANQRHHALERVLRGDRDVRAEVSEGRRRGDRGGAHAAVRPGADGGVDDLPGGLAAAQLPVGLLNSAPMATTPLATAGPYGVHSEVGTLRKVLVCSPGLAHTRLTPANCDQLLFDDVMWVQNARRDHFDFVA